MKRIITALLLILSINAVTAQKLSTIQVDKQTYQYYLNGQWKDLIDLANRAIDQGIDFFYLRTRLGLAYYNLGKYRLAAIQFRKALDWYPQDKWTLEMLYYSYLYGGMYADAYKLIYDFPIDLRNKLLKYPDRKLQTFNIYFSSLNVVNPDGLKFDDLDGDYNIQGEQSISYGYNIPSASATWRHFRGYKTLSYAYYAYDNLYRTQENNDEIEESPEYIREHVFNYINVTSVNDRLNTIWSVSPIMGSLKRTAEITLTRGRWVNSRTSVLQTIPIFDFSTSFGIKYKLPWLDFTTYGSAQLFSLKPNLQLTLSPTFYPWAKTKYYVSPTVIVKQDLENTEAMSILSAGMLLKKRLWISGEAWYGKMGYFNTEFGDLIFNDKEKILNKLGVTLTYEFKKMAITANYSFYTKERYVEYKDPDDNTLQKPYIYQANVLTIGLIFYSNAK